MASTLPPYTWKAGYAQPAEAAATWTDDNYFVTEEGEKAHYKVPEDEEPLTSDVHPSLGRNVLRTWPTLYNGTESPESTPAWWTPQKEVDVLICGGGPFGLEVAVCLARQNISFRIVDKADAPCLAGRADAVHPRSLETLHSWGLAQEVHDEGPIMNSTAIYRNGVQLFHNASSQSDSRYRGVHIITQGQMEKIYIRDLLRHKALVERSTVVENFMVHHKDPFTTHPVEATLKNVKTGHQEIVRAKHLVGADGAASSIREQLGVPFDGLSTDIYWAIMDGVFKTDYPYFLSFSVIISAEHGGCIMVPREHGYTRFYTQISGERARKLAQNRKDRHNASSVEENRIDDHGITAEEVMEQLNKIIAPFKVEFNSALSWFSLWKVNERVARQFSSPDLRVHIGGDAAHVHSVLGAFGLNSSIWDASNLAWKLGLCLRNVAKESVLLPTYDNERRLFANRVIRCSGAYLRFVCTSNLPLAELRGLGDGLESHEENLPVVDGTTDSDRRFLIEFHGRYSMFISGMETPIVHSVICPKVPEGLSQTPTTVINGARAPNPRVCFDDGHTSYLYDKMLGVARFHLVLFASDLRGPVRDRFAHFSQKGLGPGGFWERFGECRTFNIVLVVKALPHEIGELLKAQDSENDDLKSLREHATIVFDDRVPDEDAHYWYGINHARGAVVVVRPDLWLGMSAWPEDVEAVEEYFGGFLVDQHEAHREGIGQDFHKTKAACLIN